MDYSVSKPVENASMRVVSLGAGVQSTVMLLMALHREIKPIPDVVIFADTGFEPLGVYDHLNWIEAEVAHLTNGTTKCFRVSAGNIEEDHLQGTNTTGHRFASMPLYTAKGEGMGRRQCTMEYKIAPIRQKIRELFGLEKGKRFPKEITIEQWIGISTDEIQRLKESRDKWCKHRWPLIEARMTRGDCRAWFEKKYPNRILTKSACIACPFKDNSAWRDTRDNDPESWKRAISFDQGIRKNGSTLINMEQQQFVHRSGVPLMEADLEDNAISDLFQGECEGMCGI